MTLRPRDRSVCARTSQFSKNLCIVDAYGWLAHRWELVLSPIAARRLRRCLLLACWTLCSMALTTPTAWLRTHMRLGSRVLTGPCRDLCLRCGGR